MLWRDASTPGLDEAGVDWEGLAARAAHPCSSCLEKWLDEMCLTPSHNSVSDLLHSTLFSGPVAAHSISQSRKTATDLQRANIEQESSILPSFTFPCRSLRWTHSRMRHTTTENDWRVSRIQCWRYGRICWIYEKGQAELIEFVNLLANTYCSSRFHVTSS